MDFLSYLAQLCDFKRFFVCALLVKIEQCCLEIKKHPISGVRKLVLSEVCMKLEL